MGEATAFLKIYDKDLSYVGRSVLDFGFDNKNKGIEGLAYLHRNGHDYLLGLCEEKWCNGGRSKRGPGGGQILIFRQQPGRWAYHGTLAIPADAHFKDYAGLHVSSNRVAVVSQESSALWIGTLRDSRWSFVDEGSVHLFPRSAKGKKLYCSIEGVSWLGPNRIVVVSDRAKRHGQSERCRCTEQSIHIFEISDLDH